jgi:hypothetical protein
MQVEIVIEYEIFTLEDYWGTIGFYRTKLERLCTGKKGVFDEDELFQWAEDWEIEYTSKEMLCQKLGDIIDGLNWEDVKDM